MLLGAPVRTREPRREACWERHLLDAEEKAGVEHRAGRAFHSLRRRFATKLKDDPRVDDADIAAAGGGRTRRP